MDIARDPILEVAVLYRLRGNVDLTIMAQAPKLLDYIPVMTERIAADLEVDVSAVSVSIILLFLFSAILANIRHRRVITK